MHAMSLKVRKSLKFAALLAVGIATPGMAEIIWSTGCIAWDAVNGCTTMQTCWANSQTGQYACTETNAQV